MTGPAISTFDLGELQAGTDVEVILLTPAAIRLVPSSTVTSLKSRMAIERSPLSRIPQRRFQVPRQGRWRLLVEHVDENTKGGCSIRLRNPLSPEA